MATTFGKAFLRRLAMDPERELAAMAEADVAALVQLANHRYHGGGEVIMTDELYDLVKAHLARVSPGHPLLTAVGAVVADDDARKEALPAWMGSMDKLKAPADAAAEGGGGLEAFKARVPDACYVVADKLDGVSALLHLLPPGDHDAGGQRRARLYSRGDGRVGQNISHLVPLVRGMPESAVRGRVREETLLRGELIVSRDDFRRSLAQAGANARNMVAGVVNAKVPDLRVLAHVRFVAYSVLRPAGLDQRRQLDLLAGMGFEVVHHRALAAADLTLDALSAELAARRAGSAYEVDGLVVGADAARWHVAEPGRNPAWAFAFKSLAAQEQAEVVVAGVDWSASKDGLWKPVVRFEPVQLAGVSVRRATGFHAAFVRGHVLGPGARIVVTRSGDVIPHIVAVLAPAAAGVAQMPPEGQWEMTAGGKDARLPLAGADADGSGGGQDMVAVRQLAYFLETLDVKGASGRTAERLVQAGVRTPAQALAMRPEQVPQGVANGATLPDRVLAAARAADAATLMQASNAFGRGFAGKRLQQLVDALPELLTDGCDGFVPGMERLLAVDGVSDVIAQAFLEGLPRFRRFLAETGLRPAAAVPAALGVAPAAGQQRVLAGRTVVFTGFRSAELEGRVKALGGTLGAAVSKRAAPSIVLVCKDDAARDGGGSKLRAARELGATVMTVAEFERSLLQ